MKNYLVAALALVLLVSAPACHRPFASKERHHPSKETPSKNIDTAIFEALLEEEIALDDEDLFREDDLMAEQEDLLVLEDSEDLFADQAETKEL